MYFVVLPVCLNDFCVSIYCSDYAEERNLLFREAIPELRLYCQRKGLDFQVGHVVYLNIVI